MTDVELSYVKHSLYPRLALLALSLFVVGTNAFVIAGLLPDIARTLGAQPGAVSYTITFYSIVVAVAAPAVSILVPRWSRTSLMATGLVLISAGTVVAAASSSIELFTVGRIVAALGGAALVPAATAAAAALAPPEKRGRAIAFVALGFTGAIALGSPLGTALGALGGWQLPLYGVAGLALLLAGALVVFVRDIPVAPPVSLAKRFAPLRDRRVLMTLGTTLFVIAGFNIVYIFSSSVTAQATGGSGSRLAFLLLVVGLAGIVGTVAAGHLSDRIGNRLNVTVFLGVQVLVLLALPLVAASLVGTAVLFALWGVAAMEVLVPVQHRLVDIDPATSGLALSWYTTAMYVGIALAPPLGAAATGLGGAELIPVFGAVALAAALLCFQIGHLARRPRTTDAARSASAELPTVAHQS
ncbi:MFS transporter [Compostimonas suwonensis]|uniref:Putative MFS family arabinose efflux permease n=1 Tax=Compostimonas suwonensis TaxID=1048394 RepID=A0A2M9BVP0_9MICO|nr:MFS transporter [Compostimonas suwonensis]PJJ62019.1 putative MFS family arabinose efflux permease [Compostimonas suwonensis]